MLTKKYDFRESEEKWLNYWEKNKVNEFILDQREIYSIDTPPPTVSGAIHLGHIFSYSQTEMIARYKRLKGFNVYYPFGFDDNGLPSERLVEKEHKVKAHQMSREDFQRLCYETTDRYEEGFKILFKRLGLSADLDNAYKTVSQESIKLSQLSFLDLVNHKHAYHKESPALWCNECLTSIAQAEIETKTIESSFNYLKFKTENEEEFEIATTRPELIPAIVAVFINPNDLKNNHLIGQNAIIPIVNAVVPIMADEKVAMDKGTGIVMCCTFGDQTDIEWWNKYNLPLKDIFTEYGSINDSVINYAGLKIKDARIKIIEDLSTLGLVSKIEPLSHEVSTHERCGREIEYKVVKQWFIDLLNHKEDFLKMGEQIKWHPEFMHARYKDWVSNVAWDWCISRQRYFGVPFPVWYCNDCGKAIIAKEEDLPVNPLVDIPHRPCTCGCETYIPERDVMDTWATSSISPLINMKYKAENSLEKYLRPMSLRPNAHDIIRTWDFYTIVKSFYHFQEIPWQDVMISGFILAAKGEKLSKSKDNAKLTPIGLIDEYSADVVRYWAGSGKLGNDIIFSDETLLRGRKLVNKLYNVSSFVSMHLEDYQDQNFDNFEYMDKWVIAKYEEMKINYCNYLEEYEVGLALNTLEKFFWNFCDNYIEIVKHRLYRPEEFKTGARLSGQKTIHLLLKNLLQDFSIFFPFITEELYQDIYQPSKSIHQTKYEELLYDFKKEAINGDEIINIISDVRGEKTIKQLSLKTPIKEFNINLNNELNEAIALACDDLKATLTVRNLKINIDLKQKYLINNIEFDESKEV